MNFQFNSSHIQSQSSSVNHNDSKFNRKNKSESPNDIPFSSYFENFKSYIGDFKASIKFGGISPKDYVIGNEGRNESRSFELNKNQFPENSEVREKPNESNQNRVVDKEKVSYKETNSNQEPNDEKISSKEIQKDNVQNPGIDDKGKLSKSELVNFLKSLSNKEFLSVKDKGIIAQNLQEIELVLKQLQFKGKTQVIKLLAGLNLENINANGNFTNNKVETNPQNFTLIQGQIERDNKTELNQALKSNVGNQEVDIKSKTQNTGEILRQVANQKNAGTTNNKNFMLVKPVQFTETIKNLNGQASGKMGANGNSGNFGKSGKGFSMSGENAGFQIHRSPLSNTARIEANSSVQKMNPHALIKELSSNIRHAVVNGREIMTVSLRPENLGKVNITLTKTKEIINLKLNVDNRMIKENIEHRVNELKESLQSQGLGEFTVEVNISNSGSYDGFQNSAENTKVNSINNSDTKKVVEKTENYVDLRENQALNVKA